jgi:hypothetical protein
VPTEAGQKYNIEAWRKVFEYANILWCVHSFSAHGILKIKLRPEMADITSRIRNMFMKGHTVDHVVGELMRQKQLDILHNIFVRL